MLPGFFGSARSQNSNVSPHPLLSPPLPGRRKVQGSVLEALGRQALWKFRGAFPLGGGPPICSVPQCRTLSPFSWGWASHLPTRPLFASAVSGPLSRTPGQFSFFDRCLPSASRIHFAKVFSFPPTPVTRRQLIPPRT